MKAENKTELWTTRWLFFRLSAVFILLQYSPYIYAGGSCQENIYLEVGKQGLVSCHFENFDIIGWINGDGDITSTSPFIYMERSQIYGRGYRSGDYDMHPNGSLIINDVKLKNEFNYTVLFVPHTAGANEYFQVPVKVYVPPDLWHPVVNGLTNQQQVVLHGIRSGFITCSMAGVRPKVDLEWVASPDEITLDGTPNVTNNSDGTYDVSLNSNFRVLGGAMGNVILMCRATGHKANPFTSETEVYVLNKNLPVVNGFYNQKHIILDVNREGELSCTSKGVPESVSSELSIVSPLSSNEISQETTSSKRNNNDGTFNIKSSSHFRVLSRSMERVALECRVFDRTTNTSLDVTTVELFLPENQESVCTSRWSPDVNTVILVILFFMNVCYFCGLHILKKQKGRMDYQSRKMMLIQYNEACAGCNEIRRTVLTAVDTFIVASIYHYFCIIHFPLQLEMNQHARERQKP